MVNTVIRKAYDMGVTLFNTAEAYGPFANFMVKVVQWKHSFLLYVLISIPCLTFSQKSDSTKVASYFGGTVMVTNKGISSIPNLTLGKPAAIFTMSVGRRVRFEPEFRFALEGKPWMFIFWWRYDFLNTEKNLIKIRANPNLVFNTISVTTNNVTTDIQKTSRTLTGELTTTHFLTKNVSIGAYYMYVYGIEKDAIKNTHYLALRTAFSNLKISNQFFMGFNPSVYFLKMDENHGFYSNATLTFGKRNCPLTFSILINKTIHTGIPIGQDFLWNVSLTYAFNGKYIKQ